MCLKEIATLIFFILGIIGINHAQENSIFTSELYYGQINGIYSSLKMEPGYMHNDATEGRYYGLIQGNDGSTYILMADKTGAKELKGTAWDKFTAEEYAFIITLNTQGLDFSFSGPQSAERVTIKYYSDANKLVASSGPAQTLSNSAPAASGGNRDNRLVGVWRRTESYSSSSFGGDGFSMVNEWIMVLNADGSVELSSKNAGGTGSVSGSSQGQVQRGYWKTENKLFYTSDTGNAPWMNIGEYLIDSQRMMIKQPSGNQLWERIR
ncbi:MAG: hypothetical protein RLZZ241_250 [Bacteroidota bacterium]|jgi:hypothetical protein